MEKSKKISWLDITPIAISIIALLISVWTTYVKDFKKHPHIKYYQSWSIHRPAKYIDLHPSKDDHSKLGILLSEIGEDTIWLIYEITITNIGDKKSEPVEITFQNLEDFIISSKDVTGLSANPVMLWEPLTFNKPSFNNSVLSLTPITESNTIRLVLYKRVGFWAGKNAIAMKDVPYIASIQSSDTKIESSNEKPFEKGSLKNLQNYLSSQYSKLYENINPAGNLIHKN